MVWYDLDGETPWCQVFQVESVSSDDKVSNSTFFYERKWCFWYVRRVWCNNDTCMIENEKLFFNREIEIMYE